jgi:hypothetical protein
MSWEGITGLAALVGLLITIATLIYSRGNLDARFKMLEARVAEDREKNACQHNDFYETNRDVAGVKVEIANLVKSLDEVKIDLREILTRLPKGL